MELKGKVINFLGDSITEGVGASSTEKNYVSLMEKSCELKEARNYGIGGTRIARQSVMSDSPFDNDFNMRADIMEDADLVVVFGGTNDYGHGQAELGKFSDREVFTFYGAMHTLCLKLIKKYTSNKIVFLTPLHRMNEDTMQGTWKPEGVEQRPLIDYVNAIREVCEYYSIPVLDMYKEGQMPGNVWNWCEKYMPDGLHPNDKGYEIIANKLKKFLENL